jgi:hypothetical protein
VDHGETSSIETPATRSAARHAGVSFAVWLVAGVALAFSLVDLPAFGIGISGSGSSQRIWVQTTGAIG